MLKLRCLARCEHPAVHAVLLLVQACSGELMQKQTAAAQCRYALTVWFRKGRGAGVQPEADEDLPQHRKGQPARAQSAAADSTSSVQQETGHRAGAQSAAADAASSTPYTAPPIAEHQSSSSERIFVSIAAFRDPETRWTVRDLLSKASQHERLRIAVVWQLDAASEAELTDLQIPAYQKRLVRTSSGLLLSAEAMRSVLTVDSSAIPGWCRRSGSASEKPQGI